ncbi:hypothetical protein A4S06_03350 [Erysipelotrichaceae bacterium MTC7]|nr:hypothetical protein A4S06_03350 [Erysipelotrichaceae bacterium MTC7]
MAKKKTTKRTNKKKDRALESEVLLYVYCLLFITVALIGLLSVGLVGEMLNHGLRFVVGESTPAIFVLFLILCVYYMIKKTFKGMNKKLVIMLIIGFLLIQTLLTTFMDVDFKGQAFLTYYMDNTGNILSGAFHAGGGIVGALLYSLSTILFDKTGTYILLAGLTLIYILVALRKKDREMIKAWFTRIGEKHEVRKENRKIKKVADKEAKLFDYEEPEVEPEEDFADLLYQTSEPTNVGILADDVHEPEVTTPFVQEEHITEQPTERLVSTDYSRYKLPSINLLNVPERKGKNSSNVNAANESGKRLVYILKQFDVNTQLVATHIGPSVTKFELKVEEGVRVNKISNLQQDIKMGLAAKDIRIEAPIPGKSTVGIEIPNQEKTLVNIRDLLRTIPQSNANKKLLFTLGKDLMGNNVYGELNKMPHLLIAGATGSGKSVCVNSIITSLLMRTKPDEVKMLLIDPKKVEFTMYANIPHLLGPVITDGDSANRALKVVVNIMEERYNYFSQAGVRNIAGYNEFVKKTGAKPLPWIVVIIDELADLMLVAAKEVEASIQRITQLARAAGIHLIVATQRPSVDVITGVIKANIPSRIAFAVSSAIDSRTILDQQGAEKLLGLGDMLYIPQGENSPVRVQGCFVSDDEVEAIANACSSQAGPNYEDAFIRLEEHDGQVASTISSDPLFDEVYQFVIESQKASTSFIQRKFSIGYSRAARLIDLLEEQGVIGPANGSKPREVYRKPATDE